MKLWVLKAINDGDGIPEFTWDSCFGMVIREETEQKAREYAACCSLFEGRDVWLDSNKTTCDLLSVDGEPDCILEDVRNG